MKGASIYKKKEDFIIHSLSKTDVGLNIASDPYFNLGNPVETSVLVKAIKDAVRNSKKKVPTPKDWMVFARKGADELKVKSVKDLEKKDSFHCDIYCDDSNFLVFTPSKHADRGQGFLYKSKENAVKVSFDATDDEIFDALEMAFSRCE